MIVMVCDKCGKVIGRDLKDIGMKLYPDVQTHIEPPWPEDRHCGIHYKVYNYCTDCAEEIKKYIDAMSREASRTYWRTKL